MANARKYGLTKADIVRIAADQGGICAIEGCGEPHTTEAPLEIDHDHSVGLAAVRGLLCHRCNIAVEAIEDIPHLVPAMYAYLERTQWNAIRPSTPAKLLQPDTRKQRRNQRWREGMARAKAEGRMGNPNGAAPFRRAGKGNVAAVAAEIANADNYAADIRPIIEDIRAGGITSVKGIAQELTKRGILTARGTTSWDATRVRRLLARTGQNG